MHEDTSRQDVCINDWYDNICIDRIAIYISSIVTLKRVCHPLVWTLVNTYMCNLHSENIHLDKNGQLI